MERDHLPRSVEQDSVPFVWTGVGSNLGQGLPVVGAVVGDGKRQPAGDQQPAGGQGQSANSANGDPAPLVGQCELCRGGDEGSQRDGYPDCQVDNVAWGRRVWQEEHRYRGHHGHHSQPSSSFPIPGPILGWAYDFPGQPGGDSRQQGIQQGVADADHGTEERFTHQVAYLGKRGERWVETGAEIAQGHLEAR